MSVINEVQIDPFTEPDINSIVEIDARITGRKKDLFWRGLKDCNPLDTRCFVAHHEHQVVGYVLGEIRAWEFGQEPCGWLLTIGVDPGMTRHGIGQRLLAALRAWLKERSVKDLRTMVSHDQGILHRFFRTNGFTGGPYVQLETEVSS